MGFTTTRQKYCTHLSFSKNTDQSIIANDIESQLKQDRGYKKGLLYVFRYLNSGYNAEDIVNECFTVVLTYNAFKVPRILFYHNNFKTNHAHTRTN